MRLTTGCACTLVVSDWQRRGHAYRKQIVKDIMNNITVQQSKQCDTSLIECCELSWLIVEDINSSNKKNLNRSRRKEGDTKQCVAEKHREDAN